MNSEFAERSPNEQRSATNLDSIVIALCAGSLLGLIWIAQGRMTDKQFVHPMHSPNDRSRFATIRALGDNDTYAIGSIHSDGTYTEGSIVAEPGWDTIDKVRRPDNGLLYSSKPPLLPTLLSFEYRLLKLIPTFSYTPEQGWQNTGQLDFAHHAVALVRTLVLSCNWLPFVVYLMLFARLLVRITSDLWVRLFTLASAGSGTYLSGFGVTLNNHTIAACCVFFAVYPVLLVWLDDRRDWWLFALSGFFAGFASVLELPAAALVAVLFLGLLAKDVLRTLSGFLVLSLIPLGGHFYTNFQVTGSIMPAYEKKEWYEFEGSYWKQDATGRLVGTSKDPVTGAVIVGDPKGIDNQHEPWYVYLFHMWLGHHGVFSLTPVLLFAAIGVGRAMAGSDRVWKVVALLVSAVTVVVVAFYTIAPALGRGQRNYGGMCNGMRWLFWLIPLWLLFMPIGLEWKSRCAGFRRIALILLVISCASAYYASRNPWTRPWLHELLYQTGWIGY